MLKKKTKLNVDKKRLCFNQPKELFEELKQYPKESYINYDDFQLYIFDDGRVDEEEEPRKIKAVVILPDKSSLGAFTFTGYKIKGKIYCYFDFENRALYKVENRDIQGNKYNGEAYLPYIANILGLRLNNYTEIEIALDVNHNVIAKIRKLIKDHENYDMFLNGKKITDNDRKIEGYLEIYERSRNKLDKYPTLFFKQKKSGSPTIRVYNKTKEIAASGKEYISEWDEFGRQDIYRIEVNVKNEYYKDFAKSLQDDIRYNAIAGEIEGQDSLLLSDEYKHTIWQYFALRMVYFRSKRGNRDIITLEDIAEGEAL